MKKRIDIRIVWLLPLLFFAIFFTSCKTTRKSTVKKTLKRHGFEFLKQKMDSNELDFDYLTAKLRLKYDNGKSSTNLSAQLRIKKDSIIWISFSPAMGIEAARVELTRDSVKFINRLNKTYIADEYGMLDTLINSSVDYFIIQSMIIGSEVPGYKLYKYKVRDAGDYYLLVMEKKRKREKEIKNGNKNNEILVEKIWLTPDTYRLKKLELHELDKKEKKLTVEYDDYRSVNGQLFPYKLHIKIKSEKSIKIDVSYSRVQFVDKLSFPFRISSKYKKAF